MRLKEIVEDIGQPQPNERAELLRRAEEAGFDLHSSRTSPDEIIAAANAPPKMRMTVTDQTTEDEIRDFIRRAGRSQS